MFRSKRRAQVGPTSDGTRGPSDRPSGGTRGPSDRPSGGTRGPSDYPSYGGTWNPSFEPSG